MSYRRAVKKEAPKKVAISYYSKQKVTCPICKKQFPREELLSGGGRMIAGNLTDELRRIFEPSAKCGPIYPMIYAVGACPYCHQAMLWSDMDQIRNDSDVVGKVLDTEKQRKAAVETIFPHYNLNHDRTLLDGAAMYYLALLTYEQMPSGYSPTIKKAIICLRLAWLCGDIQGLCSERNYNYIQQVFYRKSLFFYQMALAYEMERSESITGIANYGPDIDKNYGYDGVIYLSGLLEYKYGQRSDVLARLKKLDDCKRAIARIFGLGKSTKNKPGPLLEHSRNLYDNLTKEIKDANNPEFVVDDDE